MDLVARGIALAQAGQWGDALEQFRICAAIAPTNAAVWSNVAFALRTLGRTDEAAEAVAKAVALDPSIADAWNVYGLVEQDRRRFDDARSHFQRAVALNSRFALAWMNLGNSEHALGNIAAAKDAFVKALAIDARLPEVYYNLGLLHQNATGNLEQAIANYRQAVALAPSYALAHHNLGHVLFLTGRFDEAWREHVWRTPGRHPLPPRDAAHVRIVAEQGLGDTLFYLRYAPLLREHGPVLEFAGDARLHPMLARTGLFEVLMGKDAATRDDDVLAGDLALATSPSPLGEGWGGGAVPTPLPLTADPARLAPVKERLRALGAPPYIAIAWRAGTAKTGLHETLSKAAPLDALARALPARDATIVSVQRDPQPGETEALAQVLGRPVHDLSAVNRDLEDMLALMDAVDRYAGVSSTNVHLRASLGRDTHVLVPFPPEWRWMAEGPSPWFPAARVFRQDKSRDWSAAFAALGADLSRLSRASP